MKTNILVYVLYGLLTGMSEFLPVSPSGHQYLYNLMLDVDTYEHLLSLVIHLGCLVAAIICCRKRLAHIRREWRISVTPYRKRKRQPDRLAVLDARLVLAGCIPMMIGIFCTPLVYKYFRSLPALICVLIATGIIGYIPQFFRGGNRDSRSMTQADGLMMGVCAGLTAVPGVSWIGMLISFGLLRKCSKEYILDIALLFSIPAMLARAILDGIYLVRLGLAGVTGLYVAICCLAAAMAFCGAWVAIKFMQYLAVKTGFSEFAFYNWGLAMVCFIFYLMT